MGIFNKNNTKEYQSDYVSSGIYACGVEIEIPNDKVFDIDDEDIRTLKKNINKQKGLLERIIKQNKGNMVNKLNKDGFDITEKDLEIENISTDLNSNDNSIVKYDIFFKDCGGVKPYLLLELKDSRQVINTHISYFR